MTTEGEEVAAHLIGRVETGHAFGAFTKDPVVTMTLWAISIPKPGEFAMEPHQARLLAYALLDSADKADARTPPT